MKKETSKNMKKENIIVPVEWLSDLARYAELAEKDKNYIMHLIGFASSAKTFLFKRNKILCRTSQRF